MSSTKTPTFTPKNSDLNLEKEKGKFRLPLNLSGIVNSLAEDDSVRIQSSSDRYIRRKTTEDLKEKNIPGSAASIGQPRLSSLSLDIVEIKMDSGREVDAPNLMPMSGRPTDRALRLVNQQ